MTIFPDPNPTLLRYKGRDKRGVAVVGNVNEVGLADWVESKFNAGWRWLEVTDGGDTVASICKNLDNDQRIWWSE